MSTQKARSVHEDADRLVAPTSHGNEVAATGDCPVCGRRGVPLAVVRRTGAFACANEFACFAAHRSRLPLLVVVVAGNRAEAEGYRRRTGLGPREFIYATPHSVRGLSRVTSIARVGTWSDRRDLPEIEGHLAIVAMRGVRA